MMTNRIIGYSCDKILMMLLLLLLPLVFASNILPAFVSLSGEASPYLLRGYSRQVCSSCYADLVLRVLFMSLMTARRMKIRQRNCIIRV